MMPVNARLPMPSSTIISQVQQNQSSQAQLSLSLPSSLLQPSNNLLFSTQLMTTTHSNGSTSTLASSTTLNQISNNNLSNSLTSNELHARFDMWTECLAELFTLSESADSFLLKWINALSHVNY